MLENTLVTLSDAFSSILVYPPMVWGMLAGNLGTIPALIISGLIVIGMYVVSKTVLKWTLNRIKGLFRKKEVSLATVNIA